MIFFVTEVVIGVLVYIYIGWRFIISTRLSSFYKTILWLVLVLFMIIPSLPFILHSYNIEARWVDILAWIGYMSLGFLVTVFMLLVLKDISYLFTIAVRTFILLARKLFSFTAKTKENNNPARRQFLTSSINFAIICTSGTLVGYGAYQARRCPTVIETSIPFYDLPHGLESLRIVQISDIHIGDTIKRDFVQKVVDRVNSLEPDIIALTGDVADGSVSYLRKSASPLSELSARYGCYFVTGNHDYYSGIEAWVEEVRQLGFTPLLNEHRVLYHGGARILLAGVTDYSAERFVRSHASNPLAALSGAPKCNLKIALAHQPCSVFDVAQSGFDLQLSGHTHGGQSFPGQFIEMLQPPHFVAGLYKFKNTWVYVNRATGYWGPPLRLSVQSEITLIKLTKEKRFKIST